MQQSTTDSGVERARRAAWEQLQRALREAAQRELGGLAASGPAFEGFARPPLWRALRDTRFFRDGSAAEGAELARQWNVQPSFQRLFQGSVAALQHVGLITRHGDRLTGPDAARRRELDAELSRYPDERSALLDAQPDLAAHITLLEACVARLLEVLRGEVSGTDVLFPNGALTLVEGIYRGNRVSDAFNRLLASAIAAAVGSLAAELPAGEPIRVLELGAGTGGSSAFVLEALSPWSGRVAYSYTDVSQKFLIHARRHFAPRYPFVVPQRFDLEHPPSDELPLGSCELVFATNVLHATTNIRRTLTHIAALMAPGGALLINEPTHVQHFGTLTFGLLDGWWLYDDAERRLPHSPLLGLEAWYRELEATGYGAFASFGVGDGDASPQHVLAARHAGAARPAEARSPAAASFGPFRPLNARLILSQRVDAKLTDKKREYLDAFTAHFCGTHPTAKSRAQAYRATYADQRAIAFFHPTLKELCFPLELERAEGARVWDVDGNEYIDVAMDFGCNLLGHRPPAVVQAMKDQLRRGLALGLRSPAATRAAQRLCGLTGHERALFTQSGTEAVMTAVRLARHATRRQTLVIFSNSYHGHFDGVLAFGGLEEGRALSKPIAAAIPPGAVRDVVVLDYNAPESLDWIRRHASSLAAVLVEPMQSRRLGLRPGAFLRELRQLATSADVALIFDEMITGFRVHPGGAQAWFGVRADLCTYGKILGGGIGQGAVAGSARFLDAVDGGFWRFEDDSQPEAERTWIGGTHAQSALGMAAADAVLGHLEQAGPALQSRLNGATAELARRINEHFIAEEVPLMVLYFGSLFRFEPNGPLSPIDLNLLLYTLRDKGVMVSEIGNNFLSTAHEPAHVDRVVQSVATAVSDLRMGGYLPRRAPREEPPLPEPPYRSEPDRRARSPRFEALLASLPRP